jgi:Porin subfamily
MRIFAIAVLIALLPVVPALAQNKPATHKPATSNQPAAPTKAQPEKRAKACEEYGAGFKPIDGTGTCVKIGGYVRMQGSAP